MKNMLLLFILISFFSCKKKEQQSKTQVKNIKDTTYCNYLKNPIINSDSISLYNKHYKSIIKTYSLFNEKIIDSSKEKIEICYHNEVNIIFLQKQDTVFNININAPFLIEKYKSFYDEYENISKKDIYNDLSIIKPIESLKLDSVILSGARTNHVYFTCYSSDYKSNENYKIDIGVDYLKDIGSNFITNQLEKIN